jgi:hypothetical protein
MRYKQGHYRCQNPEKYIGNVDNIIFRSSLEYHFFRIFDKNPSILAWGSEEIMIPYYFPIDKKMHRYFPDNILKVKKRDGTEEKILVEIKPEAFLTPPGKPKRTTKGYIDRVNDYVRNRSKWAAAQEWCKQHGCKFQILTENDLKRKK